MNEPLEGEPAALPAPPNIREYTVSELSAALKRTVEGEFPYVRVRGEISGFTRAGSGHLYMALKDEKAVLDAVCWRGVAGGLKFAPEDGLEVVCTGKLTTYAPRSRYQLVIETMEPAGEGALMALLEERRKKLAAEGLFDAARKQPIPFLPEVIGVVTSPTGAVIRDILHRLRDRFPRHVLVWPVQVQGTGAAEQIAAAVAGFNRLEDGGRVARPDVLIVARGGGSLEDLWAFNEEIVVRAVADSAIPVISAVGHETDTTLIDHAADLRAPTPTAAAEMAVPVRAELMSTIATLSGRLIRATTRLADERRMRLIALARALPGAEDLLARAQQRFDELAGRLPRALHASTHHHHSELARAAAGLRPFILRQKLARAGRDLDLVWGRAAPALSRVLHEAETRLGGTARLLTSLGYRQVLARGYAVVRDAGGQVVTRAAGVRLGDALDIEFHDDTVSSVVTGADAKHRSRRLRAPSGKRGSDDQGSLF